MNFLKKMLGLGDRTTREQGEIEDALVDKTTEELVQKMLPALREGFEQQFSKELAAKGITDPQLVAEHLAAGLRGMEQGLRETTRARVLEGVRGAMKKHKEGT